MPAIAAIDRIPLVQTQATPPCRPLVLLAREARARVTGRILIGLWLALLTGCASTFDASTVAGAVASTNHFGFDLYRRAGAGRGNVICSPASAAVALTMATAGARGETQAQMVRVLRLQPARLDAAHDSFAGLLGALNNKDGQQGLSLHVADRVWGQEGMAFKPDFLAVLAERYKAPFQPLDFAGHTEAATSAINRWGAAETHGRIKEILPSLDSAVRLVLTNAVYFKGRWIRSFDPGSTRDRPFAVPGREVTVKMMETTDTFAHARVGDVQIVQLPYAGGLSMLVVLPDSPSGLEAIEARVAAGYDDWIARLRPRRVEVQLPRWKLTSELSLGTFLRAMGMPLAFTPAADFSGITDSAPIYISAVLQQAFIDVNEGGTEAAAVTAVIMSTESAEVVAPPSVVFHVDHPFLYLIRDDTTGVILFVGRVVDPS
jgi:serpin B